ncbi:hypothetical protein [Amycolatopsis regifaucium]|uniref:Uncharacterized protein n=1 Tax=Amycolatopsis regifaucium TaxID=546365 RepID=A0A154MGK6_9PSEU|nr:hypothetical protein [Amycolatopsis regifaucium]KZB83634.1 hypothetical protein AVL48_36165 [Amycolatopsis regifaucium]OKA03848.1 hypothetical protein ATP06_0234090 [Amycolatopsis regifaucium]SFJ66211.1 hypothetical protein SAMN04489731_12927 [Amycolatopsis regifaucium]
MLKHTIAACLTAAGLIALAPAASAQSNPITLSPEESQKLCADWLPKLTQRTAKLTDRVNGGPEIRGSVANLKARAEDQRKKGHNDVADRLQKRADKRSGRLPELNAAKQKLDAFTGAHCKAGK